MLDRFIKYADKALNSIMIVFCVLLTLIGGYAIYDSYRLYDDAVLDDKILSLKPKNDDEFDLAAMQELNSDIEGWITIYETSIDYPILHSQNNLDYLNQDYDGSYSVGGSIFSDYRNKFGFMDDYTVVYGHNMVTGQMFSDIKKYESDEYFRGHLYGVLYTKDQIYKLEVINIAKVNAYRDEIYNLITYANNHNEELVSLINQKAININAPFGHNKLLLLSTCDSYGSNDRTTLLVSLTASNKDEAREVADKTKDLLVASSSTVAGSNEKNITNNDNFWPIIIVIILIMIALYLGNKCYRRHKQNKTLDLP